MRAKKLIAGFATIALFLVLLPVPGALAQGSGPLQVELAVTDTGVECQKGCDAVSYGADKWLYTISVEQGRQVEITWVWAHKGYIQDTHIFVLEGYKLEWDKISSENKVAKVQLIADKPGTFTMKCDVECDVHDYLQRGSLKVSRGGSGGGAAALTPTKLSLTPSSPVTAGGEPVTVLATLRDGKGAPVPKAEVRFYVESAFGGQKGPMEIGAAKTDANGALTFQYTPTGGGVGEDGTAKYVATEGGRRHVITAKFPGMGILDESQEAVQILEVGDAHSAYEVKPVGLDRIRGSGQIGLAVLILTIWSIFAFVLFQAVGVSWSKGKKPAGSP